MLETVLIVLLVLFLVGGLGYPYWSRGRPRPAPAYGGHILYVLALVILIIILVRLL